MGCPSMTDTIASPLRWQMEDRLNLFLEDYARQCEVKGDQRIRHVKHVGVVPIADAVRMLKEVPSARMY
jgi:hypothetical protein